MITNSIHYFVITCQSRSIAEAADKLFISRQALSLTLKRFEDELGMQLFIRDRKGIKLTPVGEAFYKRCLKIDNDINDAVSEARSFVLKNRMVIKIAFSLIALRLLTVPRIMGFEKKQSNTHLEFRSMPTAEAWEMLAGSQLDFVCSIHPPKDYGFRSHLVKASSASLLVPRFSPLASAGIITPRLLDGCTLLNTNDILRCDRNGKKQNLNITFHPFTNDPASISEAVSKGIGCYAVASNVLSVFNTDELAVVPVADGIMNFSLYLTCLTKRDLSKEDKALVTYIKSISK